MQHPNHPDPPHRPESVSGHDTDHDAKHDLEPDASVSFVSEFRDYLRARKRWWLLPLFVLLLLIGGLLALAAKHAVIAPFIYTLF